MGPLRQVLPLYIHSRHIIRGAELACCSALRDAVTSLTEASREAMELVVSVVAAGRKSLMGRGRCCRLAAGLLLPLLVGAAYAAFAYVLSMNEALWKEVSVQYDLSGDVRYNVTEVLNIFELGPLGHGEGRGACIPDEQAARWIEQVDDDHNGVDQEELLELFQELPRPFLPAKTVERMQRLVRFSWYLRLAHAICSLLLLTLPLVLVAVGLRWLQRESRERNVLSKKLGNADREARALQREIVQTRERMGRASREMARLTDERRRADQELRAAQEDLLERERLLGALADPAGELLLEGWHAPGREIHFLYASPLLYLTRAGVPVLVDALRVDEEYSLLQEALSRVRDGNSTLTADLATPQRLMELVLSDSPGLCLHVSCHGVEGCLQLEDRIGRMEALHAPTLRKWLSGTPRRTALEVVVLLSCHSEAVGRVLLEAGVRHVVCTRGRLPDRTARQFTAAFWGRLASPESSVQEAFDRALVLLRTHGPEAACSEHLLVLLTDSPQRGEEAESPSSSSASKPLLPLRWAPSRARTPGGPETLHLEPAPEDFLGREFVHCRVLATLLGQGGKPRRVVCAHGERGVGRTAFLGFLARFAHTPGRLFHGGVLYDSAWSARNEPLPWLWLEAVWRLAGQEAWELEAAGLHPDCPTFELLERLCFELRAIPAKNLLLIIDDADRSYSCDIQECVGKLLTRTNISILMASEEPWPSDIHGYKVVPVPVQRLDGQSSARLFLRRVRRPLHRGDFEEFGGGNVEGEAVAVAPLEDWQAHVAALVMHPLLQFLGGHPRRIREAAEQVTEDLESLYELLTRLSTNGGAL